MKKIILAIFVLCTSIAFALTPRYGGTLVVSEPSGPVSLDPSHTTDVYSGHITAELYDTLIEFKHGTTEIQPALAKSWDISKDGLEYTFYLRKGVYFSKTKYFKKTSEVTSKDVVFSLKRQFDKTNPYNKVGGPFKYWLSMGMSSIIKDVVALDKYTVKITLKKKEAPILANLAMDFASILSKDYANMLLKKGKSDELGKKPVGTGPFIFKKYIKDSKVVLISNKNYWNKRPYLDRLIFKVIPTGSVRAAELKVGSIQLMGSNMPNPQEIKMLEKVPSVKILKQAGLNVFFLGFNTEKKPFDNVVVRRAISHAIDTKAIVKAVYGKVGKVAIAPIPPIMWSYNKALKGYDYNPKKAKKLLKKAGYANGFKTTLWVSNHSSIGIQVLQIAQANLAKVGVKAKIVQYDWGTFLKKISMGDHDIAFLGWMGDNGDPDNFLNILLSKKSAMHKPSQNRSFWKNEEFSKLIDEAKVTTNISKRTKLYKKAQLIFEKEAPWIPIANRMDVYLMLKKVHGYKISPVPTERFRKVWLEK